jgi:hypothetical protein
MIDKTPVLLAYPSEDGKTVRAWCPFCVAWHIHSPTPGHRIAHCGAMSHGRGPTPFEETGYILKIAVNPVGR